MQSSAENDDRVITLANEVLLLPAARRDEFLRTKCKDQEDLYAQVVEVVEWEERMGNFLAQPLIKFIDLEEQEPPPQVFQPGQAISNRFVIMREVGRGGMGIVYEAFDRKRNQRIAIKCAQPGFGRLLSPELEGALKVRHPNICLVNEIHTAATDHGELDFLTMEYLEGETLAARLDRADKLSPQEALAIARQVCAGLAAAHAAGILHRDLKAANVILARHEDGGSLRVVITDFGLATEARLESEFAGGTPRYMAPELWDGQKPSKASDVYALGVILYEMVTGQEPPVSAGGDDRYDCPAPSRAVSGLGHKWDKAIAPCLVWNPQERPGADAVLSIIQRVPMYRSPIFAMALLALLTSSAALWRPVTDYLRPPDIRLAILPADATGDLTQTGSDALQKLGNLVRALPRGKPSITAILPSEAAQKNVRTPEEAQSVLHATHAVRVTLRKEGEEIVAEETILELSHHTSIGSISNRYGMDGRSSIPIALAGEVAAALHLPGTVARDAITPAARAPYETGVYFLNRDRFSFDQAVSSLREAAYLDRQSVLPRAGLAEAFIDKYEVEGDLKSLADAEVAIGEAEALNPDSVLAHLAAGRLMQRHGRYETALLEYRRVQEIEPNNVEAQLRIGTVYEAELMPDRATECYRKAIALDPKYYKSYEELGAFYYHEGKNSEAAEQFRKDVELAPARVDAYVSLGAILSDLGQYPEAEKVLRKSLELRQTAGALNNLGAALAYQERDAEAVGYYSQAARLRPRSYLYLLNLGDSYRRLSRVTDARATYRRAKDLVLNELATNPRSGYSRVSLAYFEARLGDPEEAEQEMVQALQLAPADTKVRRRAILTYEAIGQRDAALRILAASGTPLVQELQRHPDMTDFCRDSRFIKLKETMKQGG
jgi:eukaryotic-like serine/threonine-protein kinase